MKTKQKTYKSLKILAPSSDKMKKKIKAPYKNQPDYYGNIKFTLFKLTQKTLISYNS